MQYELPTPSHVSINVYDVMGRRVTTLVNENKEAGFHTVTWNGRNDQQKFVPSGIYIYRLENESGLNLSKPMVLLK
ncbi:MAG: T9SS C-terminal target domain-containing protein [Gemmatimonadetes bacterium]|nr:MAG: T9SS C-terminal target domain-containing protein [Gemmatimonadota bacterium]